MPKSESADELISITFSNESDETADLYWHNYEGQLVKYGTVARGSSFTQWTYATHPWSARAVGNPEK